MERTKSSNEVREWLKSLNLQCYAESFISKGYDNIFVCCHLDESDLDIIGVDLPGHRKTILKNIKLGGYNNNNSFHSLPVSISSNNKKQNFRILLIRHGKSLANENKKFYIEMADHIIPLSEEGKNQAKNAGEQLVKYFKNIYGETPPPNYRCRLWTSPYLRARQTSDIIIDTANDWIKSYCESIYLGEQQFGLFEGADWDGGLDISYPKEVEYYRKASRFGGRFWAKVPLGESRFDVCLRVCRAFGSFYRDAIRHSITDLVIVSHGITIRAFVMMWMHYKPEWFETENNPTNCSIRVIDNGKDEGYIFGGTESQRDLLNKTSLV